MYSQAKHLLNTNNTPTEFKICTATPTWKGNVTRHFYLRFCQLITKILYIILVDVFLVSSLTLDMFNIKSMSATKQNNLITQKKRIYMLTKN